MKIIMAILTTLFLSCVVCAGNVTLYEYGSNYIIWEMSENTTEIYVDGIEIPISSPYYGQYNVHPNSEHIACDAYGSCVSITTPNDGYSIFTNWLIYLILLAVCAISYYIPLSYAFAVIYSIYLIGDYLPSHSAIFGEYVLVVSLMVMGIVLSHRGYTRHV